MNAVATRPLMAPLVLPRVSLPVVAGIAFAGFIASTVSFGEAPSLDSASELVASATAPQATVRIVKHAHRATPVLVMAPAKG